jgi:hypothetical protein
MKLLKNKKAKYFITLVSIFLIVSLGVFAYLVNKNKNKSEQPGFIGKKSNLLLQSYQDAERVWFYIDMAAKYSAPRAYFMTAYEGAMGSCGEYYNFKLWDFEDANCLPMNGNSPTQNLQDGFEREMNNELDSYFGLAPDLVIPKNNYNTNIIDQGGKIIITGDAVTPITFEVKKDSTQFYNSIQAAYSPEGFDVADIGRWCAKQGGEKEIKAKMMELYTALAPFIQEGINAAGGQSAIPEITVPLLVAMIHQESPGGLRECQCSYAGACGIVQFIASTARTYGLIDSTGDHRCDNRLNIMAAVRYMKKMAYDDDFKQYTYKIPFALGGYNGGEDMIGSKIKRTIAKTGKNDPSWKDIVDNTGMNSQTLYYVPCIMIKKQLFEQMMGQGVVSSSLQSPSPIVTTEPEGDAPEGEDRPGEAPAPQTPPAPTAPQTK